MNGGPGVAFGDYVIFDCHTSLFHGSGLWGTLGRVTFETMCFFTRLADVYTTIFQQAWLLESA